MHKTDWVTDKCIGYPDLCDLRFANIIGHHTDQYNIEEMFKIYDFNNNMVAYGESQRAVFRVRHEEGIVHWIGFEFENVKYEDIPFQVWKLLN